MPRNQTTWKESKEQNEPSYKRGRKWTHTTELTQGYGRWNNSIMGFTKANVRKYHLVPTEVKKNNVFFFFWSIQCVLLLKKKEEQCVRLKAKGPKRTDCTHASVISAHNKQRWPNKYLYWINNDGLTQKNNNDGYIINSSMITNLEVSKWALLRPNGKKDWIGSVCISYGSRIY